MTYITALTPHLISVFYPFSYSSVLVSCNLAISWNLQGFFLDSFFFLELMFCSKISMIFIFTAIRLYLKTSEIFLTILLKVSPNTPHPTFWLFFSLYHVLPSIYYMRFSSLCLSTVFMFPYCSYLKLKPRERFYCAYVFLILYSMFS